MLLHATTIDMSRKFEFGCHHAVAKWRAVDLNLRGHGDAQPGAAVLLAMDIAPAQGIVQQRRCPGFGPIRIPHTVAARRQQGADPDSMGLRMRAFVARRCPAHCTAGAAAMASSGRAWMGLFGGVFPWIGGVFVQVDRKLS